MAKKIVLITDYTWQSIDIERRVLADADADPLVAHEGSEEELVRLVTGADAILTCFKKVTPAVVRAGTHLQVIGRYGIGVDNIAVDVATELGILVTNVPAYCLDEVAEHALAFLFAFGRNVPHYNNAVRAADWRLYSSRPLFRISGKTLGIVGFGKIGRRLAEKALGLGLRIIAYDPTVSDDQIQAAGALPVSMDDLLTRSDFVSLHIPLTPETRGWMNRERLLRMKPGAFLINTARGGLVDHDALLDALREGWIAGAGIDVFEPEILPPEHPLLAQSNLIATPHAAFYSEESLQELQSKAARNIAAVLNGQRPESIVNPAVLSLPRWEHLRTG